MEHLVGLIRRGKIHCKFLQKDGQIVELNTKEVERNLFLRTMRRIAPSEIKQYSMQSIPLTPPVLEYTTSKQKEVFFNTEEPTKQVVEKYIKEYQQTRDELARNKAMHYLVGYYDKRLEATIKKMSFNASPEKVDDFKEDFYCRVIDQDVLGKFDKSKSQLTTLLWKVTNTVVVNSYHKHKKVEAATSYLNEPLLHSPSSERTTELQDLIPNDKDAYEEVEANAIEEKFEDFLLSKKKIPACIQVFRMLASGYKVKEIAHEIGMSNMTTSAFCKDVKKAILEFYQENNLCSSFVSKIKKSHNI